MNKSDKERLFFLDWGQKQMTLEILNLCMWAQNFDTQLNLSLTCADEMLILALPNPSK